MVRSRLEHGFALHPNRQNPYARFHAFPDDLLRPLLPPGLVLDTLDDFGFAAVALVKTERLRPSFVSARLAQNVFLSGVLANAFHVAGIDCRWKRGRLVP